MKKIATIAGMLLVSVFMSGCAQVMAMKQPKPFTPTCLATGTERTKIVAELGQPLASEPRGDKLVDEYKYVDGGKKNGGFSKGTRVVLYTGGDLFTLFLDQIIWMPLEHYGFAGIDHAVTVDYAKSDDGAWVAEKVSDEMLKSRSSKKDDSKQGQGTVKEIVKH
jgi:hypothetical protein